MKTRSGRQTVSSSTDIANRSRREFVKRSAGLTFCFTLSGLVGCEKDQLVEKSSDVAHKDFSPGIWVTITTNGKIKIYSPADELGQGSLTALPLIFAEELDANWDDVECELSPVNDDLFGNPKFMGAMYTVASASVTGYYKILRHCGAEVRRVLLDNVAQHWQIPVEELGTEPSLVIHQKTNRRISYAEIAGFATLPDSLPEISTEELKSPEDFRLIGHSVPRQDVKEKVMGSCAYSINENPPGLVHCVAVRSPIMNAQVLKLDDSAARQLAGVEDVIAREHSVLIVADNYYQALEARRLLKIEWSRVGEVNDYDSEQAMQEHIALASEDEGDAYLWHEQGDVRSEFDKSEKIISRQYQTDYVYHAQIEPLNATVWVKEGGKEAEVWVGTQAPSVSLNAVARVTGIAKDKIALHRSMVGGGFGRRGLYDMDFVDDAAWLSKRLQRPVKVIWSREDDVAAGWFKPMSAQKLKAAIDGEGNISAWQHRVAVQEPLATSETIMYEQMGRRPIISMRGTTRETYEFPNQLSEHLETKPGIRTLSLLGVGYTPNMFAVETFMDELAAELGVDALAFRLQHLKKSERGQRVLNTVAEQAGWGKSRKDGRELGIAFADYHHTLLAGIAEISLENTQINVHEFWVAIDPGIAVQPDNIRAQVEGAVTYGLGSALYERITFKSGLVQQSNYDNYVVPRMSETPKINIEILANGDEPTAVGQASAVLVAPAITNAFARLTGTRLSHMPFTRERVKQALDV